MFPSVNKLQQLLVKVYNYGKYYFTCSIESTLVADVNINKKIRNRFFPTAFKPSENVKFHFQLDQKLRILGDPGNQNVLINSF